MHWPKARRRSILTLTAVAPYALGSPTSGTVTISDAAPVVTVAAFDAVASETGPDLGTFRFIAHRQPDLVADGDLHGDAARR